MATPAPAFNILELERPSPGGEFIGDLSTATEVHLVRGLPFERAVRDPLVVLDHVERDQPLDGRDVVERVQEQPAMLERAHHASMSEFEKLTSI